MRPAAAPITTCTLAGSALACSLTIGLYACGSGRPGLGTLPRGVDAAHLNLVVVTLDTTRADRLGCYGSKDVATPRLDRFAGEGVRFERTVAPMPLTLPAHSTLFTSLVPGAHGVRDNGGYKLSPDALTLAEVLQHAGFATGGFVSAFVLDHRWGIAQGFDHYLDDFDLKAEQNLAMGEIQRPGKDTIDAALTWIGEVRDKRFFAWIHLYEPHTPYDPPEPYASRYAGRPYDGEIAYTDELVGRILDELDRLDLTKRTVVAILGDHGESLGEHGEHGHGYFVYEQVAHVPFLLRTPYASLAGRVDPDVVPTIAIAPTLLDLLGLPGGLPAAQGRSLVPSLAGGAPAARDGYTETFYARFHYGWSELRAIRGKRWHFIEAPKPELYDLDADPGETANVVASQPQVVERMRESLAEYERDSTPKLATVAPVEEDEETLRKLASLGYIGGTSGNTDASWRSLPDPKDRLEVYDRMGRIRGLVKAERGDEAIPLLEQVITEAPEVVDAYYTLANCLLRRRDYDRAIALYRKTLALRPDHDYAMIGLADALVAQGKIDDAVAGYRHFLAQDPANAQILYRLAQVELDAGRDGEADADFKKTLAAEPKTARAEVGLGVVAFRNKDEAGARAALARAVAIDPKARWARYNLALIEEAAGNETAAVQAYRAEIADYPDAYKALFNLGRLLAKAGDRDGAADAFRRAVDAHPDWGIGRFYLARSLLEAGDLDGAKNHAQRGLELDSRSQYAALGHYVLAEVYEREGRRTDAQAEVKRAQAIEKRQ